MTTDELKHERLGECPFCWKTPMYHWGERGDRQGHGWDKNCFKVVCMNCEFAIGGSSYVEARRKWNTRKGIRVWFGVKPIEKGEPTSMNQINVSTVNLESKKLKSSKFKQEKPLRLPAASA